MSFNFHRLASSPKWLRFAIVGGFGFFIDATVLIVLAHCFGLAPVPARAVSFSLAVAMTWLLNRSFTFNAELTNRIGQEFSRYFIYSVFGLGINALIYVSLVILLPIAASYPIIALIPASAATAIFNYYMTSLFVFRECLSGDRP